VADRSDIGTSLIIGHNLTEMPLEELVAKTTPTPIRQDKTTLAEMELLLCGNGLDGALEPPQSTPPAAVLFPREDDSIPPATPEDRRELTDDSSPLDTETLHLVNAVQTRAATARQLKEDRRDQEELEELNDQTVLTHTL